MAIQGKKAFYQKSEVFIAGSSSGKKLSDLLNLAFQKLTTDGQRMVINQDQSEWHVNKVEFHSDYLFFHLVHLKPGYQRSGFRPRSNGLKVVQIPAGVDTEFALHDICGFISGNDIIMYGGIPNDKSIYYYVNGVLKKAGIFGGMDFVRIDNVLKASTVREIEKYGVEDIDLDAVQNSEVIGIGAHQRSGILGKLLNSPLAKNERIKVRLHIGANGHFRKSKDEISAQMVEVAKEVVGDATNEDWDGIKITLGNGTVLKKGSHLVSEYFVVPRVGECLDSQTAAPMMLEYFQRLKATKQLVKD